MSVRMTEKEFNKLINKDTKKENHNSKFHNKKVTVDGVTYDSTKEYERHCYLKILEKAGDISNLRFHKDSIILIDDPLVKYLPDFCYIENGKKIVEDFKGMQTKEFILKKKIIISMIKKGLLDITFRIVKYENGNFIIVEEYE